ncbi:MAG: DUF4296 domain-containing protein [Muribaculaceae bacterium]|nr:DUF4296 domain-containing protein [Muribaculaceae bacterium]
MRWILFIILFGFIVSCSNTPDDVIGREDMVDLLVDIHKGEAYADLNTGQFYNDSLRKVLKQSIMLKHGVSQEQFDTSLVWYGHHINEYVEMYDEIIKRLDEEDKNIMAEARLAGETSLLAAGDSVNMWNKTSIRMLSRVIGDTIISFDLKADNDFKQGDVYQFIFRIIDDNAKFAMFIGADYKDGTIGYVSSNESAREGKYKLKFQTDSTRAIKRIYGYAQYSATNQESLFVDSIQVLRTRLNPSTYYRMSMQKVLQGKK